MQEANAQTNGEFQGLSDRFKISSRGTAQTHEALGTMANIAAITPCRDVWGRRPGKAPIINAVLLWFSTLTREEQAEYMEKGLRMLKDIDEGGGQAIARSPVPAPADTPLGRTEEG